MKKYTEAQRFGIYSKSGNDPNAKRVRPNNGRLLLDGKVIKEGMWCALGKERRELIMQGYAKERISLTY
jgi:hypothetical protein